MLYTIAVVLLILWALGLVTSYTMGGFVHVLLAAAVAVIEDDACDGTRRHRRAHGRSGRKRQQHQAQNQYC